MNENLRSAALLLGLILIQIRAPVFGRPGSGIVVDRGGAVYFTDTGQGIWKIDARGRLRSYEGPAYHFMTIDLDGLFTKTRWPSFSEPSTDIRKVGVNPTLLPSSDFPLTVGRDEALYLHAASGDRRDWIPRVRKLSPDGTAVVVASIERSGPGSSRAVQQQARADSFVGAKTGDEREVSGVKLCWCPPGQFRMGSPRSEPERRPGEDQVDVTLSKGFWMGKFEVTQGQWKQVIGKLPGDLTAELPAGADFPVGNALGFASSPSGRSNQTPRQIWSAVASEARHRFRWAHWKMR